MRVTPEYGIEPRGKGVLRRYARRTFVATAIVLACWIGSNFIRCSRVSKVESCAVCGAERHVWTSYIMGLQSGYRETEGTTEFVQTYDRLVGEPHTHSWWVTAHSISRGNLWGYGSIGEGGYSPPQIEVTEAALRSMRYFADRGPEERRQIYGRLRACPTAGDVSQLAPQLFHDIYGHPLSYGNGR